MGMKKSKIRKCSPVRCECLETRLRVEVDAPPSHSDIFQRRIKSLEAHLKDFSASSRTGSVIGTPVSRTDHSPIPAHDRPVESVTKWREDIPHVESHVEHDPQLAMPVPSSQKDEEEHEILPRRQMLTRVELETRERGTGLRASTPRVPVLQQESSSRSAKQATTSTVLAEESLAPPITMNIMNRQQQMPNTVEDDVEMQILGDSADEHIEAFERDVEMFPAERSVIEISSRRTASSVPQRKDPPTRPTTVPACPPSPITTEQRGAITPAADQDLADLADEIFGSSPVLSRSPKYGNAQLPITTPAARQPVSTVVASSKRSAPVLAPAAQPPPPPEPKFSWSSEVKRVLKETFGLQSFRSNQKEAINTTMHGDDVFVLMPTGGGKSLCCKPHFSIMFAWFD